MSVAEAVRAAPTAGEDFRPLVEQADVGICITQDGRFRYVNPVFAALHGYPAEALVGMEFLAVVHPDEHARVVEVRRLRDAGRHRAAYESRNVRRDGSVFETRVFGRAITYQGRPANLTTVSDISELVAALGEARWRARMLASHELLCRSGSVELMPGTFRAHLSAGALALLGEAEGAAVEAGVARLLRRLPADDRRRALARWRAAVPGQPFEFRHRLSRADGGSVRLLHRGMVELQADGTRRAHAIVQDVSEQLDAQVRIERLLNYDPVTGLASRVLLLRRCADAIAQSRDARPEPRRVAMLYLRVAELGRVHDALGLGASEVYATQLGARLAAACGPEDTAAYLGGPDFAVLQALPAGADAHTEALALARRVLEALEPPTTVGATELFSGGQIGIALTPDDATAPVELLERSYTACQRSAPATASFFTRAAGDAAVRRLRLEGALRRACERNEFTLHYQPQVDLPSGRITGAEALLRWTSEEFGPVSPAEFVPIAEEIGLIATIGDWVWRTACTQSAAWRRAGLPPLHIAVNLSPHQFDQPDLVDKLQSVLLETGADPTLLGIEVTESVLARDLAGARGMLVELSAIGIQISLDDFGTGYSNLGVLRALPIDVLKIDRSLVHDVTADPGDVSITRAVLGLARSLQMEVVAEGVETDGQLKLLVANGCERMQGFIFSPPVPAEELARMVQEERRLPERYRARERGQRTLLLVDDEAHVLSSLRRLLRGNGCRIVTAASGEEGLERLAEQEVDVILSDQRMPGMTGVEFLRRAKELYPHTVRMVLSGYTELDTITEAVNEGAIYKFLTKPWDDERLRSHIEEAFRRKELADDNAALEAELRDANRELARSNERLEQSLARQREQLGLEEVRALHAQDLLEILPVASIGIDAEGAVAFVNRAARALVGPLGITTGVEAADVLPPDWRAAWRYADGQQRRVTLAGHPWWLSCAPLGPSDAVRGHVLSLMPALERTPELHP